MKKLQKVLVIVGPTSAGKSALAVELARKFNGEVISADSRQVYKGLDIGTGKITKREMKGIPHYLLDVLSPKRIFTAENFAAHAKKAMSDISSRGKLPIVVGGTGFYIDVLLGRISLPDVPPNPVYRSKLEKRTPNELFALLKNRDPRRARTIDPRNKHRLIRALEIVHALGRVPRPHLDAHSRANAHVEAIWIGIALPKQRLLTMITARLRARMNQGMLAEAKRLHRGGLSYRRMEQLGLEYRALARHLQKKITRAQMLAELDHDIWRYAKSQRTYWKRNREIRWFTTGEKKKIEQAVRKWV